MAPSSSIDAGAGANGGRRQEQLARVAGSPGSGGSGRGGSGNGDSGNECAGAGGHRASGDGMDHQVAAAMARHWWYRGRAAAVSALLHRAGASRGGRILDYGCGTGHMGRTLARFGVVYGVDEDQQAIDAGRAIGGFAGYAWAGRADVEDLLRTPGESVPAGGDLLSVQDRRAPGESLPASQPPGESLPPSRPPGESLPASPFTVIACLDVLEHVPDDAGVLAALTALLAPGGLLMISVPMRPDLFCEIDRLAGHVRRYSPGRLSQLFAGAGLESVAASGYVVALLPPAAAHRRRLLAGRGVAGAEFVTPLAPLNAALAAAVVAEGRLARYLSLPPGLSQITVLRTTAGAAHDDCATQAMLRSSAGAAQGDHAAELMLHPAAEVASGDRAGQSTRPPRREATP